MKWINYVAKEAIPNDGVLNVRVADNVLDDDCYTVCALIVREGKVSKQTTIQPGCYTLPDMTGWTVQQLSDWSKQTWDGSYPEVFHELRIL